MGTKRFATNAMLSGRGPMIVALNVAIMILRNFTTLNVHAQNAKTGKGMKNHEHNSKLNFLQKLHYTILKEIHFQRLISDVAEPDTAQIVEQIHARSKLIQLQNQEHRIRVRLSRINEKS